MPHGQVVALIVPGWTLPEDRDSYRFGPATVASV